MGLGNSGSNKVFVNCVSKPEPLFNVMTSTNDKWIISGTYNTFEGKLINAYVTTYEYKGESKDKLVLEFDSDNSTYSISFNFNSVSKSIINTLANGNYFGQVLKLSLYKKGDYANIYITCDGEKIGWKFDAQQVSKIFSQDQRWVDMFNKYVKENAEAYNKKNQPDVIDNIKPVINIEDDDLPF